MGRKPRYKKIYLFHVIHRWKAYTKPSKNLLKTKSLSGGILNSDLKRPRLFFTPKSLKNSLQSHFFHNSLIFWLSGCSKRPQPRVWIDIQFYTFSFWEKNNFSPSKLRTKWKQLKIWKKMAFTLSLNPWLIWCLGTTLKTPN